MNTLEELSKAIIDEIRTFREVETRRKFTDGQIVQYVGDEARRGYYKERNTDYDLRKGDLCVIASFGGPRDMVVDRIVNDEVIRYAVDFKMIKKVKVK